MMKRRKFCCGSFAYDKFWILATGGAPIGKMWFFMVLTNIWKITQKPDFRGLHQRSPGYPECVKKVSGTSMINSNTYHTTLGCIVHELGKIEIHHIFKISAHFFIITELPRICWFWQVQNVNFKIDWKRRYVTKFDEIEVWRRCYMFFAIHVKT